MSLVKHKEESTHNSNLSHASAIEVVHTGRSDEELLLEYRHNEEAAVFAELVSRYEHELYHYLRRFLGDAALAEDVFQATFLQVHLKCALFDAGRKVRPWIYTIATNQAIDAQRRNRRHRQLSLDQTHQARGEDVGSLLEVVATGETGPYETAAGKERALWVRDAVGNLPEPLQNAVKLVYFQGMKYRDAAKLMSVPVGTVKSRLHAAIQRLGQSWRELHTAGRS